MTEKVKLIGSPVDQPLKRKRGRPAKGDPVPIRLGPRERAIAQELGGGVVAEGIRLALVAAGRLGINAVQLLAAEPKTRDPKSGE